ncbi:TPA: hypothetical protein DIU27_03400 [Candidatus Collierbacteria bacterium]|uniref:Plastocyanin n=1 Tax=Candidatus Collierbacteria bacterium GW2011_GWB2_44_22 TaxID=1618387 RepID=A0A0G1KWE4_9BACT|nr:MAG: Plastocyanin [Candidatus Collierbacteria bacterium GW2011_GWA2_44_13]KKT50014.1 MAG: Plastocyanin [Candidatus Collierbacteria bacterium GW2011_GWB1_44_197]KKT52234.1 MAG: Plastocyanin [Candidatus Collierbacteria bacterium GW2011_GWB2_44_22]KKT62402.1 MAG: Plastocyanin [Candidatus Collierbacteria bacterium GW2011_GWD1_44_27]KKT66824.1 MAG: Plastocyanin [Candidatus Collierbacteria bacterium GW2011_GWC2_44_30]KKT69088.1 MAG: Blue (Type 1) copper domain-containing protein [Microgenomates g
MEETKEVEMVNVDPVSKKSQKGIVIILLIIIALIIVPKFFSSGKKTDTITATAPTSQVPVTVMADVVNGEIIVEAGSFYYKPNIIRAKKGAKVKLILNSVSMQHDFNIDELGIKVPLTKSGSFSTVEFVVDKIGEFEFYCSFGEHRKNGQVGKLIVIE